MALTTMYEGVNNSPKTSLASNITASDTTISLADASVLPDGPNIAVIGSTASAEVIIYSGKSSNTLTGCVRGKGGTTASEWSSGTSVARNFTLMDYDAICDNIRDLDTRKANSSSLGTLAEKSAVTLTTDVAGTLPIANGGTNASTAAAARTNLGLGSLATKSSVALASDVSGTLPVANGGTGLSSSPSMLTNLSTTTAASVFAASPRPGVTGTLPVANGGTGAASVAINKVFAGPSSGSAAAPSFRALAAADIPSLDTGKLGSGTLGVARGGTGVTSNPSMLTNLGTTTAASVFAASPRPGVTGTLPVANGGTGQTSLANVKTWLGLGGIQVRPNYTISSTDIGDNATLASGTIYFVI